MLVKHGVFPPQTPFGSVYTTDGLITVNGALTPSASASPLVLLASRITPTSPLLYVTPEIVTVFVPAVIVPVTVPPRVPVPADNVRVSVVSATTFAGLPSTSCDWTTTE